MWSAVECVGGEVAAELRTLREAAYTIVDWQPPLRTFRAIIGVSLACNPGPHVTDVGKPTPAPARCSPASRLARRSGLVMMPHLRPAADRRRQGGGDGDSDI
jgi:hypothetical protein